MSAHSSRRKNALYSQKKLRNNAQMNATTLLSPTEIESAARKNGWTLASLCREAKVAPSNFTRWKAGANGMTVKVYERLIAVASQKCTLNPEMV